MHLGGKITWTGYVTMLLVISAVIAQPVKGAAPITIRNSHSVTAASLRPVMSTARRAVVKREGKEWARNASYILQRDGSDWCIIAGHMIFRRDGSICGEQHYVILYVSGNGKFLGFGPPAH